MQYRRAGIALQVLVAEQCIQSLEFLLSCCNQLACGHGLGVGVDLEVMPR